LGLCLAFFWCFWFEWSGDVLTERSLSMEEEKKRRENGEERKEEE
jgi:hypothetical protein